jgi:hypothetical protein
MRGLEPANLLAESCGRHRRDEEWDDDEDGYGQRTGTVRRCDKYREHERRSQGDHERPRARRCASDESADQQDRIDLPGHAAWDPMLHT